METATSNEKTVVHQGIIASGPNPQIKLEPNEDLQSAVILPYRSDGSIYRGVLYIYSNQTSRSNIKS